MHITPDDLRVLVLEVALVRLEVLDLQLQAVAAVPLPGEVLCGFNRHFPFKQDVEEDFADFAVRGVVGGPGRGGDEPFVFVLEEDRSFGGVVVAHASGPHGGPFQVGGWVRHGVDGTWVWSWSCWLAGTQI